MPRPPAAADLEKEKGENEETKKETWRPSEAGIKEGEVPAGLALRRGRSQRGWH